MTETHNGTPRPIEATTIDRMHDRVLAALAQAPTRTGHFVEDGTWKQAFVGQRSYWTRDSYDHGNWTSGFWVGSLLHLAELGAPLDPELVAALAGATAARALDETTHDLGFMFWPSAVLLARTRREARDEPAAARWAHVALSAAETLGRRFRPAGQYLQAFGALDDERGQPTSTIDTMMNLPLLWWAADWFAREDLHEVAARHAHTTAQDFVRDDGATFHIVQHHADGSLASRGTFQGAGDDSCWTRGQAWAVHGFIDAYLATGDEQFADMTEHCLDYWIQRADLTELPPYDLGATTGLYDASAGAILASGLCDALDDEGLSQRLRARERLDTVLAALESQARFAGPAGIIGRSTYSAPHGWGVDGALPYGDYFYLRALARTSAQPPA